MTRKIIQYSEHRTKSQCSYIYSPLLVEENKTEEASILGLEVSLHDLTNAGCSYFTAQFTFYYALNHLH